MRAARLLSLVAALQARGRCTAAELAEELGVSVRTILRDLETLSGAGIPVVTERGPGGGCALLPGYARRLALSGEEADALGLAGVPSAAAELGFGALLAAGQRKLMAALPPRVRETAVRAGQRFHLDPGDWFREATDHPALPQVARAVWSDSELDLLYARGDAKQVRRRVRPIGLVLKSGLWYLVAEVEDRPRVYRVSRIVEVECDGARFERDGDFDLAGFWSRWAEAFERGLPEYPALLRLSPWLQQNLSFLGEAVRRAPAEPAPAREPDGWQRRPVTFERLEYARSAVLRLAGEVEVLEPRELREAVAAAARAMFELHDAPTPAGETDAGSTHG